MTSTPKKTGRPQAVYKASWGEQIVGLRRLGDGRWRTSHPNQITYREPDERLAVLRFRRWQEKQEIGNTFVIPQAVATLGNGESVRQAVALLPQPQPDPRRLTGTFLPPSDGAQPIPVTAMPIKMQVRGDRLEFGGIQVQADAFWSLVRQLLIEQPKLVAKMTGIEQVGYLSDLEKPTPSPTLAEVGELYAKRLGLSDNEVTRGKLFWAEFTKAVGVETVRELTHELVAKYEQEMQARDLAPKSLAHRYRKVRGILRYAVKRGLGLEDCRRALDVTSMLEVRKINSLDPRPIRVADFWAIFGEAKVKDDKIFMALLLDLSNGELVTRRPKNEVPRVACLWLETVAALRQVPRADDGYVFHTRVKRFTVFSVIDRWNAYRAAAGLGDDVAFSQIRDAAFSIACGTVALDKAKVLAGHRLPGSSDHYVQRNVGLVREACEAVRREFMAGKAKGTKSTGKGK